MSSPSVNAALHSAAAPAYRLVVFDFDGTLADTQAWFAGILDAVADRYQFRRIGREEWPTVRGMDARTLMNHVGLPLWKLPLVSRHVRALCARDAGSLRLFPGVAEMLAALERQGVALALVSSNGETTIRRVLGPEAGRFRHFGCGAGLFGKARHLTRAMRACGVPARATLAIGDELRDLDAARAAGCAFGAVEWGYASAAALAARRPAHRFTTPDEITALLSGPA